MKTILAIAFFLGSVLVSSNAQKVNIIPEPTSISYREGKFNVDSKTVIAINSEEARNAANFLAEYFQQFYKLKVPVKKAQAAKGNVIFLSITPAENASKESYKLTVTPAAMTAEAHACAWILYAVQTIIPLLTAEASNSLANGIPALEIMDTPSNQYRGVMLDVSRHFFPASFVKKFIDYLALHKINTFHWHLTEDQGWRIEIKKYPLLTSVGSKRNGTIIGRYPGKANDNLEYGGFYTQKEIKEIVAYASERFINIIPEIEMPGHASAAIAAYPWLSCFPNEKTRFKDSLTSNKTVAGQAAGGKKYVQETWGVFNDVFCAGNDSTFQFIENVLSEVVALFPSKYVHVGGDECPKENWKRCPKCQQRKTSNGLKDEHEVQSYFIKRVENILAKHNRSLIGWDEILEGGLAPNAMVMSWRGEKGGIDAANDGHYVVMSPNSHLYFDHKQRKNEDSVTIGGFSPLKKVYSYNPMPAAILPEKRKFILGAQANLWTEYVGNVNKLEYMLFPRLAALSEVLWTKPEQKSWDRFREKLPSQEMRYELWKINYAKNVVDEQ